MLRATMEPVRLEDARPTDPYRVLFDQLAAGAARCRLVVQGDQVVRVEIIDNNRSFSAVRGVLPELLGMFSRVRSYRRSETIHVRYGDALLAATAHPVGDPVSELMVVIENVTVQEQVIWLESRLGEAMTRFQQAFHRNAAAMVIARRDDLRIIEVNARWCELFATTRAEVIGKTSVELGLISPSQAEARIAEHRQFSSGYDVELELKTRRGELVTVLASARPVELPEGMCTLTTLIDITARKHAEEAFRIAFSASPNGMILVDAVTETIVAVNDRLLAMTGDRREELVGRPGSDLCLLSPSRDSLLAEIDRTGRLESAEIELARRGGGGVWTLLSTELITLQGKAHRLSVFTDMAARKQHEARLLTKHLIGRWLAESAPLDSVLPRLLDALCRGEGWSVGSIWLLDGAPAALRCRASWSDPAIDLDASSLNGACAPEPGGLLERVCQTGTAEQTLLDPEACAIGEAAVAAGIGHVVAFPIMRGNDAIGVIAAAVRDGADMLEPSRCGLLDSVGRLLGLYLERMRAEASLRELNIELERRVLDRTRELESTNRDLESFGYSVSHDLRAPLRAIAGFSEVLLEDFSAELPDEARRLLQRIHGNGERLGRLVEDLLAFSRLGRGELRRAPVDLDPLVRSVCDELISGSRHALVDRLDLRIAPLGRAYADASLLRTVWTNLIDNALKYAQHRDRIVIEIGRQHRDGETIYQVRDNGVGFDMAHAGRLFGVFSRLHSPTEFEGTGIGLANVRRIIERHCGRIAAASEPDRGATFEFTLGVECSGA